MTARKMRIRRRGLKAGTARSMKLIMDPCHSSPTIHSLALSLPLPLAHVGKERRKEVQRGEIGM